MNINWRAVVIGLIITVILVAMLSQLKLGYLGAIIGGLVTGYLITGTYTDGAVNGGYQQVLVDLSVYLHLRFYLKEALFQ